MSDPFNTGIRKELMPNANPNVKNIKPTNAKGMAKFLLDYYFLAVMDVETSLCRLVYAYASYGVPSIVGGA